MSLRFPGMQVKPLFPSRRTTILPCGSVSTILAVLATFAGPADIARAILACVESSAALWAAMCRGIPSMSIIAAINIRKVILSFVNVIWGPFAPCRHCLTTSVLKPLIECLHLLHGVGRKQVINGYVGWGDQN